MKLALPECSKAERQIWLREMWDNLGRTAGEFIKTRQMLNKAISNLKAYIIWQTTMAVLLLVLI